MPNSLPDPLIPPAPNVRYVSPPEGTEIVIKPATWTAKDIILIGMFALWGFAFLWFTLGKTDRDPGPPPVPVMQSIPPGHTALIEHDANGTIRSTVAPTK